MMKKISIILVMLFWCNVGFAIDYAPNLEKKEGEHYKVYNEYVNRLHNFWTRYWDDNSCKNIAFAGPTAFMDLENCYYRILKKHFRATVGNKSQRLLDVNHSYYRRQFGLAKKFAKLSVAGYYNPDAYESQWVANVKSWVSDLDYELDKFAMAQNSKYLEEPTQPSPGDGKIVAAASGTGFFVSRGGHLVTNHHVIEGCNVIKVNFKGKEIETKIIAVDKSNDLAIVKAKINPSKVFPVSNEDVSLLQDVVVAGFPLGKKVSSAIKIHKGSVTALAGYNDNYSNFQTDATINQGNSGGPIMNQKGNILGVAVATWVEKGVQSVHFGIKSSTLKTFAKSNSVNFLQPNFREMSNADLGKLITEATVYLECWMTVAKIKTMIASRDNKKAFYSKFK